MNGEYSWVARCVVLEGRISSITMRDLTDANSPQPENLPCLNPPDI